MINRAYWCSKDNIPILDRYCPVCGEKSNISFPQKARPVFKEEINMIANVTTEPSIKRYHTFDLWTNNRVYYLNGYPIFRVIGSDEKELRLSYYKNGEEYFIPRRPRYRKQKLINANKTALLLLEYEVINYMREINKQYKNITSIISFSGGKDSSVVSHLSKKAFRGSSTLIHVFSDTTNETPSTYKFIRQFCMDNPSTPFIWAKPGIDFKKMCNQMGPPSRIHRWCCVLFKTNPFSEYLSYLVSNSKYIAYTGIRKDESINRSNYNRIMDTSKIGGQISVYPIFNWSELEEWLYIISEQIPINRDYYRGFRRVGCAICPFNSSWSEIVTRYYYPNINNQFRKILQTYAVKLGKHNLEEYITSNAWKCRAGGRGLDFSNSKLRRLLPGEDNIVNYKLTKPLYPDFISYIKPLGIIQEIMLEDKEKVFIIKKNDTNILFQISLKENTYDLQIAYSNKEVMTEYLPRLEKQLIKYQNCIFCGYCSAVCPTGAIYQYENSYSINEMKCSHCLKCVNIAHGSGCIIAKSITTSGGRVNVNS